MFDTQAKEGLFTEIDQLIFNEDLARYNKLVFENGQLFERFISTMKVHRIFIIAIFYYLHFRTNNNPTGPNSVLELKLMFLEV